MGKPLEISTKVIAAFPGSGKTFFFNTHSNCLDSDSSDYSWIKDLEGKNTKERNPDFPGNYIKHIRENLGKVDIIFVSSHGVVRDALVEAGIKFTLVYPNILLKNEYIKRFQERKSPQGFIDLLDRNWELWTVECHLQENCEKVELKSGQFITDVI